jgi:type IV pilus assembly protein PilA
MRIQDRLNKLRNKRGFTLVELMIVVAIIGVLAALAIYGVRKYLTNAKSAEARMGVGRLAKDAQLAFEKESVADGIINLTATADIAHKLCTSALPVPAVPPPNQKYQSSPDDWKTAALGTPTAPISAGWSCLKFSMSDPQYYQYEYQLVTGDNTGVAAAKDKDLYTAFARGDLDGDGVPSTLSMDGQVQAATSGELVLTLAATIKEDAIEE